LRKKNKITINSANNTVSNKKNSNLRMVTIHTPLNKKHSISLNYSNINNEDKLYKKNIKMSKMKKSKHFIYDIYNQHEPDFISGTSNVKYGHLKKCSYSFTKFEEQIIPKTQNNTKILLKKSKTFIDETEYTKKRNEKYTSCDFDTNNEINNDIIDFEGEKEIESKFYEYQYGSLIGNKSVTNCMRNYLDNWSTFINDFNDNGNNNIKSNKSEKENQLNENNLMINYSSLSQERLTDNSGYLTPTSQKDDACSYEGSTLINQIEEDDNIFEDSIVTEDEMYSEFSPVILDDFDDVCPFENNYYEDERIRKVLNSKVLPSDYIGKIPSFPEKPMGDLGKLMEKYRI